MTEATGLRRVLERVAAPIRAENARGTFSPSSFATPLSVAAHALANDCTICVTATSNEAEALRDAVAALLGEGDEVALWPAWDTHPLERVSPDNQSMALRALLRSRIAEGRAPKVVIASARSIAQILSPDGLEAPLVVRRGERARPRRLHRVTRARRVPAREPRRAPRGVRGARRHRRRLAGAGP